jgi:hypothetical protein
LDGGINCIERFDPDEDGRLLSFENLVHHADIFSPSTSQTGLWKDDVMSPVAEGTLSVNATVVLTPCRLTPDSELRSDFRRIFVEETDFDFTLTSSGGVKFPVHQAILNGRSKLLAGLSARIMKSRQRVFTDIDTTTMEQILQFIYHGGTSGITTNKEAVFIAAHKYGIPLLKSICAEHLEQEHDNGLSAVERNLALAVQYNQPSLKEASENFLMKEFLRFKAGEGTLVALADSENVDEILLVARKFDLPALKEVCTNFLAGQNTGEKLDRKRP